MKILVTELPEHAQALIAHMTDVLEPRVLPAGWGYLPDGRTYANCRKYVSQSGLRVFVEVEAQRHQGAIQIWLHLSVSRTDRVPSYRELCNVKELFIGAEVAAVHVFPKRSEHYNFHEHCLHLWTRLDGDDSWLPDFRHESVAI